MAILLMRKGALLSPNTIIIRVNYKLAIGLPECFRGHNGTDDPKMTKLYKIQGTINIYSKSLIVLE